RHGQGQQQRCCFLHGLSPLPLQKSGRPAPPFIAFIIATERPPGKFTISGTSYTFFISYPFFRLLTNTILHTLTFFTLRPARRRPGCHTGTVAPSGPRSAATPPQALRAAAPVRPALNTPTP